MPLSLQIASCSILGMELQCVILRKNSRKREKWECTQKKKQCVWPSIVEWTVIIVAQNTQSEMLAYVQRQHFFSFLHCVCSARYQRSRRFRAAEATRPSTSRSYKKFPFSLASPAFESNQHQCAGPKWRFHNRFALCKRGEKMFECERKYSTQWRREKIIMEYEELCSYLHRASSRSDSISSLSFFHSDDDMAATPNMAEHWQRTEKELLKTEKTDYKISHS